MDMTFNHFLFSLGSIILLDIILGGDNAVVIGMASRQLPKHMQKKVMYLGTAGAVVRNYDFKMASWIFCGHRSCRNGL